MMALWSYRDWIGSDFETKMEKQMEFEMLLERSKQNWEEYQNAKSAFQIITYVHILQLNQNKYSEKK
jgi:hypothetical protein